MEKERIHHLGKSLHIWKVVHNGESIEMVYMEVIIQGGLRVLVLKWWWF